MVKPKSESKFKVGDILYYYFNNEIYTVEVIKEFKNGKYRIRTYNECIDINFTALPEELKTRKEVI